MTREEIYKALSEFESALDDIREENGYYDCEEFDRLFTQIFGEYCTYCTCTPDNDTAEIDTFASDIANSCISLQNKGYKLIDAVSQYIEDEIITVISFQ